MKMIIDINPEMKDWIVNGFPDEEDMPRILRVIKHATPLEECEDCVSRQAVLDLIEHYNSDGLGSVFYGYEQGVKFADAVNKLPPVTAEKVGHWISNAEDDLKISEYTCSNCKGLSDEDSDFCPKCGSYNGGGDNGNE